MAGAISPKGFGISSARRAGPGNTSAARCGGMSPILITGAILGQMKLTKPQAASATKIVRSHQERRRYERGADVRPPTDPLIYRFYELIIVNGPALKALIEEEFGEASCRRSTSTWTSREGRSQGRPPADRHDRQIPAVQTLWCHRQRSGPGSEGGVEPHSAGRGAADHSERTTSGSAARTVSAWSGST